MSAEPVSFWVTYGNFLFKWRNIVFTVVALILFLLFIPNTQLRWLPVLGISVAAAGQLLRGIVIGYAYIKRGGLNKKVYAENLVTEGFFAMCRNPLYVGNILIILGLMIVHGNAVMMLIAAFFFLTSYHAIVAAEEHYLLQKFGDAYRDYCRDVPRWGVRIGRFREATDGMAFNLKRVIYKDYSTFCSWVGQVLVLLAYRQYSATGSVSFLWAVGLLLVIAAAGLIRKIKKSGF